ncbi:chloride channel protein [Sulfurovum sp. NBC37-1]|uniref:chloride channel protein n=1 Tax=Sulfurovum sp. (strain NBC37-1) TaxID=387093 RepID=UPI00015875D7|nr:chloride channel protein [Sulfurovum sp. NBC37-1]BAF71225.1 voltage-gated chloride channel [Sulfurovum sp. NBC37-1]
MIRKHITEQTAIFFSVAKWVFLSSVVGVIIGAVVTLFLNILEYADTSRSFLPFNYYYLLPFALVFTVWLVKTFAPSAEGHGTEKVISAVHKSDGKIDVSVIPVKLLATVISIFAGASVGKEGPGAQIGAGVASALSELFKFSKQDRKKLVICGISAGFATVFGTPVAGAIFGVEVLIIGVILYDVLLPSFIAGFAAFTTAQFLGIKYTYYNLHFYQDISLDFGLIIKVVIAALFFGFVSDIVITSVSHTAKVIKELKFNIYLKAFAGGLLIVILTLIFGEEYIGLGLDTINHTVNPNSTYLLDIHWYTFLLKTLFTSLSLGAGGSGGIITPIFYIGATSGHAFGALIAPEHVIIFSALGFVSVLSATTNTPIASTIMAVELFGIDIAHYAALGAVIAFLISGHRSIFSSQILAMKKSEMLSVKIGEEVENINTELEDTEKSKFNKLKERLNTKRELLKAQKRNKKKS